MRFLLGFWICVAFNNSYLHAASPAVPILVYHRLGPVRADSMTTTTEHFKEQIDLLRKNNFSIVSLADFISWKLGATPGLPPRAIVLTFDDGHESVYTDARPIVIRSRIPVTLFIYPSCISHASYAMTWGQLSELVATSLFDVESHTYWHPNFKQEAKKLDRDAYAAFVGIQLEKSKAVLEHNLARPVNLLAWPFGIYDSYLMNRANALGYRAGFSIECRAATASDPTMAIPRCLVSDEDVGNRFLRLLDTAVRNAKS
jgi:peptidoglycan/xylan/chitin deacetylase (PgdA/CDA1 family)